MKRHDVKEEDIDIAWVPGAFEIPLIADKMAKSKKYDAVICLGTSGSVEQQAIMIMYVTSIQRNRTGIIKYRNSSFIRSCYNRKYRAGD